MKYIMYLLVWGLLLALDSLEHYLYAYVVDNTFGNFYIFSFIILVKLILKKFLHYNEYINPETISMILSL